MPDITLEKLVFFVFAVTPGFIAIQVYALKCPGQKKDVTSSLVEVVTYSVANLSVWSWWVFSIIRLPFVQIHPLEFTAAFLVVCLVSPVLLSLGWYWLRTKHLHHKFGVDHPTQRGWEFFVRHHREFWVLFHLKNGKHLGGYFGGKSFAATYPQEPELYVEEVWRVDERGEFVEMVEGTLGSVIRIADCERVEFFQVKPEGESNETSLHRERSGGTGGDGGAGSSDGAGDSGDGRPARAGECGSDAASPAPGRLGDGTPEKPSNDAAGQVTAV